MTMMMMMMLATLVVAIVKNYGNSGSRSSSSSSGVAGSSCSRFYNNNKSAYNLASFSAPPLPPPLLSTPSSLTSLSSLHLTICLCQYSQRYSHVVSWQLDASVTCPVYLRDGSAALPGAWRYRVWYTGTGGDSLTCTLYVTLHHEMSRNVPSLLLQ